VDADRTFAYYDPIDTLPESGQDWWRSQVEVQPVTVAR
jgi:lysine 2,3-aminomutase